MYRPIQSVFTVSTGTEYRCNDRLELYSEGEEGRSDLYDDDDCDSDADHCVGADLETLLVLEVEVPHQTCRGLETAVVLFCHVHAN